MTVRELEQHEWPRLETLLNELGMPIPPAATSRIVIAEEDGEIIAWWSAIQVVHLEPIWIHPDHRGGILPGKMWRILRGILETCGVPAAYCFAADETVAGYLHRLGLKVLPYATFMYLNSALTEDLPCPSLPSSVPEPPSARPF
jgi:hypothetical protein